MKSFPLPFCIANTTLIIVETRQAAYSENKQHKIDSPSQSIKTGNGQNKTRRAISIFLHTLRIWLHISLGVLACLLADSFALTHTHAPFTLFLETIFFLCNYAKAFSLFYDNERESAVQKKKKKEKCTLYCWCCGASVRLCILYFAVCNTKKKREPARSSALILSPKVHKFSTDPCVEFHFTLRCKCIRHLAA